MINIRLPYPPTANHLHTIARGRKILSATGKSYYKMVAVEVLSQLKRVPAMSGRLSVKIIATMPDKRRRDLDNILKAALDGMKYAGVYEDDSQIDDLQIIRSAVDKPGWLDIEIIETNSIY